MVPNCFYQFNLITFLECLPFKHSSPQKRQDICQISLTLRKIAKYQLPAAGNLCYLLNLNPEVLDVGRCGYLENKVLIPKGAEFIRA